MRVRGHGHWPSLRRLCLVDIDDDDRPLRGDAGLDDLENIEGPQAKLFERCADR